MKIPRRKLRGVAVLFALYETESHAAVLVAVGVVLWLIGSAFRRPGLRHATRLVGAAALSSGLLLVLATPAH